MYWFAIANGERAGRKKGTEARNHEFTNAFIQNDQIAQMKNEDEDWCSKEKQGTQPTHSHTSDREMIINAIGHGIDRNGTRCFKTLLAKCTRQNKSTAQGEEQKQQNEMKQNKTQRY